MNNSVRNPSENTHHLLLAGASDGMKENCISVDHARRYRRNYSTLVYSSANISVRPKGEVRKQFMNSLSYTTVSQAI